MNALSADDRERWMRAISDKVSYDVGYSLSLVIVCHSPDECAVLEFCMRT